jgi:hypothetical protein
MKRQSNYLDNKIINHHILEPSANIMTPKIGSSRLLGITLGKKEHCWIYSAPEQSKCGGPYQEQQI